MKKIATVVLLALTIPSVSAETLLEKAKRKLEEALQGGATPQAKQPEQVPLQKTDAQPTPQKTPIQPVEQDVNPFADVQSEASKPVKKEESKKAEQDSNPFADVQNEAPKALDVAAVIHDDIFKPIIEQKVFKLTIGKPIPFSKSGLPSSIPMVKKNGEEAILVFNVESKLDESFNKDLSQKLGSLSSSNFRSKGAFNLVSNITWDVSADIVIAYQYNKVSKDKPRENDLSLHTTSQFDYQSYIFNKAKFKFDKELGLRKSFKSQRFLEPGTLVFEIKNADSQVIQSELLAFSPTERITAHLNKMDERITYVQFNDASADYSAPWMLLGRQQLNAPYGYYIIRPESTFQILVVVDKQVLKNARSVNVRLD